MSNKFTIGKIQPTDEEHSDFVDSFCYMMAGKQVELIDSYMLLYVKKKPWFIPLFLYKWICKKLLVIHLFRK